MSRRYSIAEARSRLPTIVDEAEAGHEIHLTRRGRPVAVVVSSQAFDRLRDRRRSFAETYGTFLERHALDEVGLDPGFGRAVRDRTVGRKVLV